MVKIANNKGLIKEFRVCLWWPGSSAIQISFSRIFHEGLLTGGFLLHPFGSTLCSHRGHSFSLLPTPPLTDGALESGHSSPTWELCEGQPLPGADPHQPAQAFPGPWFSSWPTPPPRLLSPPHLPTPAPSPFVLHRDFSLRLPCAVNLLLASWRTWTDRTPTHQILRQFSNIIFFFKKW